MAQHTPSPKAARATSTPSSPTSHSIDSGAESGTSRRGSNPDPAVVSYHQTLSSHMASLLRSVSISPTSSSTRLGGSVTAHSYPAPFNAPSSSSRIPAHNPNRRQSAPSTSAAAAAAAAASSRDPLAHRASEGGLADIRHEEPIVVSPDASFVASSSVTFSRSIPASRSASGSGSRSRSSTTTKSNSKYQATMSGYMSSSLTEEKEEHHTAPTSVSPSEPEEKDDEFQLHPSDVDHKDVDNADQDDMDQPQEWTARPLNCHEMPSPLPPLTHESNASRAHHKDESPSADATPAAPKIDPRPLAASPSSIDQRSGEQLRDEEHQRAWETEGKRIWLAIPQGFSLRLGDGTKRAKQSPVVGTHSASMDSRVALGQEQTAPRLDSGSVSPTSLGRIGSGFGLGLHFASADGMHAEQYEMHKDRVVLDEAPLRRQSESDAVDLPSIRSSLELANPSSVGGATSRAFNASTTTTSVIGASRGLSRPQSTRELRGKANEAAVAEAVANMALTDVVGLSHSRSADAPMGGAMVVLMSTEADAATADGSSIAGQRRSERGTREGTHRDPEALERSYLARKEERHRRREAELRKRVERWLSAIEPLDGSPLLPPEIPPHIPSPSTATALLRASPLSFTQSFHLHPHLQSATSSGAQTVVSTPIAGFGSSVATAGTTTISSTATSSSATASGHKPLGPLTAGDIVLPFTSPIEAASRATTRTQDHLDVDLAVKLRALESLTGKPELEQWAARMSAVKQYVPLKQPILLTNQGDLDSGF